MSDERAVSIPLIPGSPPELIVHDRLTVCPYLPDRTARLPLRLPTRPLSHPEFDQRLQAGDRRQGHVLYRTKCPACRACEPIRLDVTRFSPSRSQRRVLRRADGRVSVEVGPPEVDQRRVDLYNAHKHERGLADGQLPIDTSIYTDFLVSTCCDSFEIRYLVDGELCGLAIVDRAETALSAVYCYYDPRHESLSLGTFSILTQLALCRSWGLRYLYLGLYVAGSRAMAYKARWLPHERRVSGVWREYSW